MNIWDKVMFHTKINMDQLLFSTKAKIEPFEKEDTNFIIYKNGMSLSVWDQTLSSHKNIGQHFSFSIHFNSVGNTQENHINTPPYFKENFNTCEQNSIKWYKNSASKTFPHSETAHQ